MYAWDRAAGTRRQVTDRPEGTLMAAISPNGEWIWWFDDDRGSEFGTWMASPFGGGEAVPAAPGIDPAYPAGLALAADGTAVLGTSTDEGVRIWAWAPGCAPELLYRHREDARVAGLSRDDALFVIEHAEHGDSRHPALRVLDRAGRTVADLWDGPMLALRAGPWSPLPGDRRLIVHHERTGIRRPAIWHPAAGAVDELRLELPGEVVATWYPDAAALLLRHAHAGRSELYRYEMASGALESLPAPRGWVAPAAVRPDGRLWYQHASGARPPGLFEDGERLQTPPGEPAPPGAEFGDLRVGDVPGFLVEPPGARPHPTIFMVHGGPSDHVPDTFLPPVQAWVDHGFAVVLVNYRGSTGYGRAWRDALQGNPGFTELADLTAVRAHLVASGIADPRRLVLSGGSWGGYLTLLGLGRHPEDWSVGLARVPVADYVAAYEDSMEPLRAFDRAMFGGTPDELPDLYRERSPITYVDRVGAPVLITAGRLDPRCPIRQVENYVARLRELGRTHEYHEYGAGHGSQVVDEQIRQMELQLAFVHRHLGTPAPR